MNKLIFFLIPLIAFWASKAIATNVITKGCVASVCVGSNESTLINNSLINILDATVIREGDKYPALKVVFDDKSSAVLELENGSIWAIRITDPNFITANGVGVGSSFFEVKKAYPNATLNYGEEDGGYISLYVKELNGYFSFDTEHIFSGLQDKHLILNEQDFFKLKTKIIFIHDM
ncbi:hypothetical protein AUQ44_17325 [Vibrio cidicii]|uniref:Uncharacterized protein n=1 Tax=Vibrio cidicii TaxID=1763883 RepID=A0A151JD65_9VIBR|nr:hypothetical protein [Vibrio cidicii]KYN23690.1 hypothetical protein AUQ44_17325 [Vibrio cidicii]